MCGVCMGGGRLTREEGLTNTGKGQVVEDDNIIMM